MPEQMLPDGTWAPISWDELDAKDPDAARRMRTPIIDPADMTEGERYLYNKMQAEAEASAALSAAGLAVDDLVVEGETPVTLDDLEPREYDFEGALEDLRAREAREAG